MQAPGDRRLGLLALREEAGGKPAPNLQASEIPSLSHACSHDSS
jgi:hypothetical protein